MPALTCPHCQRERPVHDSLLGQTVSCPACKKSFVATVNGQAGHALQPAPVLLQPAMPQPSAPAAVSQQAPFTPYRARTARVAASVVWGLCLAWSFLHMADFVLSSVRVNNVMQQAAVAGTACAYLVFGYVAARCVTSILEKL